MKRLVEKDADVSAHTTCQPGPRPHWFVPFRRWHRTPRMIGGRTNRWLTATYPATWPHDRDHRDGGGYPRACHSSRARVAREKVVGVADRVARPGPTAMTIARGWGPGGEHQPRRVGGRAGSFGTPLRGRATPHDAWLREGSGFRGRVLPVREWSKVVREFRGVDHRRAGVVWVRDHVAMLNRPRHGGCELGQRCELLRRPSCNDS